MQEQYIGECYFIKMSAYDGDHRQRRGMVSPSL